VPGGPWRTATRPCPLPVEPSGMVVSKVGFLGDLLMQLKEVGREMGHTLNDIVDVLTGAIGARFYQSFDDVFLVVRDDQGVESALIPLDFI